MLAVAKAIERFHIYLYGFKFMLITDCHALIYVMNKAHLNLWIACWTLRLQNYSFSVSHRARHQMSHVDILSRISAYVKHVPLERELEFKQLQDQRLKEIAEKLEFEENDILQLIDDLVIKKFIKKSDKSRFAIPESIWNIIKITVSRLFAALTKPSKEFEPIISFLRSKRKFRTM